MNRTLREAAVRRYPSETHEPLEAHLAVFLDACNFARRLKPCAASRPTKPSAKPGRTNRTASGQILAP